MLFNETLKTLGLSPPDQRQAMLPAIVRVRDGWVGINCLTGQHWQDVCAMVGLDEFAGCQTELAWGGPELEGFYSRLQTWLDGEDVDDIVELGQPISIPVAGPSAKVVRSRAARSPRRDLLRRRAGGGLSAARSAVATEPHPGRPAHPRSPPRRAHPPELVPSRRIDGRIAARWIRRRIRRVGSRRIDGRIGARGSEPPAVRRAAGHRSGHVLGRAVRGDVPGRPRRRRDQDRVGPASRRLPVLGRGRCRRATTTTTAAASGRPPTSTSVTSRSTSPDPTGAGCWNGSSGRPTSSSRTSPRGSSSSSRSATGVSAS